jgi:riboflavin synthase alpha subunit
LFPEALLVLLVGHSDTHGNVSKSKYGKNTNADGDTIVRRVEDQLSKKVKKTPK